MSQKTNIPSGKIEIQKRNGRREHECSPESTGREKDHPEVCSQPAGAEIRHCRGQGLPGKDPEIRFAEAERAERFFHPGLGQLRSFPGNPERLLGIQGRISAKEESR